MLTNSLKRGAASFWRRALQGSEVSVGETAAERSGVPGSVGMSVTHDDALICVFHLCHQTFWSIHFTVRMAPRP